MCKPVAGSDVTKGQSLKQVAKTIGKTPTELLNRPECPRMFGYLYQWYLQIHGESKLTFSELKAWSEMTNRNLTSLEVDLLKQLDNIFWSVSR